MIEYEIGYLLSPLVAEEEVPAVLERGIRSLLGQREAEVAGEGSPKLIKLAYPIRLAQAAGQGGAITSAYFGWISFRLDQSKVVDLTTELKKVPELVRFLLIQTPARAAAPEVVPVDPSSTSDPIPVEPNTSTEAIDREIEGLLTPLTS
ncbi:MAG: 30S ribosomal protein S6 [Patescibacteria group bacterium]